VLTFFARALTECLCVYRSVKVAYIEPVMDLVLVKSAVLLTCGLKNILQYEVSTRTSDIIVTYVHCKGYRVTNLKVCQRSAGCFPILTPRVLIVIKIQMPLSHLYDSEYCMNTLI
jgi:hypothetical protein